MRKGLNKKPLQLQRLLFSSTRLHRAGVLGGTLFYYF